MLKSQYSRASAQEPVLKSQGSRAKDLEPEFKSPGPVQAAQSVGLSLKVRVGGDDHRQGFGARLDAFSALDDLQEVGVAL